MEHQIRFPHLGIVLKNVGDGINIGGFEIKYYGMIIATGFLLGLIVSYYAAKHENKFDPELVFDYLITMIIPAIVGARLYYVKSHYISSARRNIYLCFSLEMWR